MWINLAENINMNKKVKKYANKYDAFLFLFIIFYLQLI